MAGLSLSAFVDWGIDTGPIFLSGTRNIINNVSERSYVLGAFLRGKPASRVLQGGNKIKEVLFLSLASTFQWIQRNQDVNWSMPQKDVEMELDWRYALDHMSWDEVEYLTQTSGMTGTELETKYKDMQYSKQQRLWQSIVNGIEDALWYPPDGAANYAAIEGRTGTSRLPYSIPVFIHENKGGSGRFDSNWTEIEGVNPATYGGASGDGGNWDNWRVQYDATDDDDSDGDGDGIFNAFDDAMISIGFKKPGLKPEFFEKESAMKASSHMVCTSKAGLKRLMKLHRNSNDSLISPADAAYPFVRWNGVPVQDVAALDNAQLYDNAAGNDFVDEEDANVANSGPRYYIMNTDYMQVIFHKAKYFNMEPKKSPENKVGVFVVPVQSWMNVTCSSRRHQALIYPGA